MKTNAIVHSETERASIANPYRPGSCFRIASAPRVESGQKRISARIRDSDRRGHSLSHVFNQYAKKGTTAAAAADVFFRLAKSQQTIATDSAVAPQTDTLSDATRRTPAPLFVLFFSFFAFKTRRCVSCGPRNESLLRSCRLRKLRRRRGGGAESEGERLEYASAEKRVTLYATGLIFLFSSLCVEVAGYREKKATTTPRRRMSQVRKEELGGVV